MCGAVYHGGEVDARRIKLWITFIIINIIDRYWIIKVLDDGMAGEFLDVVYKDSFEMDTLEIR